MSTKQKQEKPEAANEVQEAIQLPKQEKYQTSLLVNSKSLSEFGLHRDVIRAILIDEEYTIEDAKKAIQCYIDSFKH